MQAVGRSGILEELQGGSYPYFLSAVSKRSGFGKGWLRACIGLSLMQASQVPIRGHGFVSLAAYMQQKL